MKKGFTLVEILAVIIILSIIGLIATISVGNIITNSKKKTVLNDLKVVYDKADYEYTATNKFNFITGDLDEENYEYDLRVENEIIRIYSFREKDEDGYMLDVRKCNSKMYCTYSEIEDSYIVKIDPSIIIYSFLRDEINIAKQVNEKLSELNNILANINTLVVQAHNQTNTEEDLISIKNDIAKLYDDYIQIYNYQYNGVNILQKNNGLTDKYLILYISEEDLKLNQIILENYNDDMNIINTAIEEIYKLRNYIDSKQKSLEFEASIDECINEECKINIINNIIREIYDLSYRNQYLEFGLTSIDYEFSNVELQDLFMLLDKISINLNKTEFSKDAIFKNCNSILTVNESEKVYLAARVYLKNIEEYVVTSDSVWKDQASYFQTVDGAYQEINQILERARILLIQATNSTATAETEKELQQLNEEIGKIISMTRFNNYKILTFNEKTSNYIIYNNNSYNLGQLSTNNIENSIKIIEEAIQKISINRATVGSYQNQASYLIEFNNCTDNACRKETITTCLNRMIDLANQSKNESQDTNDRISLNKEYVLLINALNHMAMLFDNENYSADNLYISKTSIINLESSNNAILVLTNALNVLQ